MRRRVFLVATLLALCMGTVSGAEQLRHPYNGSCPATDVSGNNNDGTCSNVNTGVPGQFGNAFEFPTTSQSEYVQVSSDSSINPTEAITITGWVYFDQLDSNDWNRIVTKHGAGHTNQYWVTWNNGFSSRIYDSGGSGYNINAGITPSEDTWYNFAITYSGSSGEQIFYVDGTAQKTNNIGDITPLQTSSTPLRIGAASGGLGQAMDGKVDEVRIYNEQLSAQQIQNLKNCNQVAPCSQDLPPKVTIHSPGDGSTYGSSNVSLNVSANESVSAWKYNLDGTGNTTFTPNTTLNDLSDGSHSVTVYATDSAGNTGSNSADFTVNLVTSRTSRESAA